MTGKPTRFSAKVISLGRVTIPDELRTLWHIKDGTIVELDIVSVNNPKEAI